MQKLTLKTKHLHKNFKYMTLTLGTYKGMGMVPRKILDQYLSPCQTGIKSIKGFTKTDEKTLPLKLNNVKIL